MTQLSDIDCFIEVTQCASSPADLKSAMADITGEMGFDYYALIHHVDLAPMDASLTHMTEGSLVGLTSYPDEWVETYVSRNIVSHDPVVLASHQSMIGFRWEEIPKLVPMTAAHRSVREAALRCDVDLGFTVPAHVPGEAEGSCNFATRRGRALPERNLRMAQLVGSFAFQAARSMVLRARGAKRPPVKLTQRQLDCLVLVARGKSDWEISQILGIKEETVKWYIKTVRERYDVATRIQAVLRSVFEGKIALNDIIH